MQQTRTRRILAAVLSLGLAGLGVLAFPAAASAAEIQVLNTADDGAGSLREAVANAAAGDTIVFQTGVTGMIALESTIEITQPITITGPGSTAVVITSTDGLVGPLLDVELATAGDLTISGLGFLGAGDEHDDEEEGLYAGETAAPLGELALDGVAFSGFAHWSRGGVAVRVEAAAEVSITGSTFTDNTTGFETEGGAVRLDQITGAVVVSDSTFTGNKTGGGGGAIWIEDAGSVSILGSMLQENDAEYDGGAVHLDHSAGEVAVENSQFLGNGAHNGAGLAVDDADTVVSIDGSLFDGNRSSGEGGGIHFGGAIPATGSVTITDSVFTGNGAMGGGGILIKEDVLAPVVVSDSTFTENDALVGAGLASWRTSGNLLVEFCTFADNLSYDGSGLELAQSGTAGGAITIANSTFTGNTVSDGELGVSVSAMLTTGTLEIVNSTFDEPGGYDETPYALHFRVRNEGTPEFTVRNATIVAQGGILFDVDDEVGDVAGILEVSHTILSTLGAPAITVEGEPGTATIEWSILSGGVDAAVTQGAGNQLGVASIGLGPLQDNGGPTQTMLPGGGSPALDAGNLAFTGPATDQRGAGFDRVVGIVDIGAVEVPAALATTGAADVLPWSAGALALVLAGGVLLSVRRRRLRASAPR